ncbi:MAG: hypothetical protein JRG82_02860 [Deltaproteobacteria bacterium]|nr:hypothetical protein [Deltaproteobacteria bacterium]
MLPPPSFPYGVPHRLFKLARAKKPLEESFIRTEQVLSTRRQTHDLLERVISRYALANFLDPVEVFCVNGSCITVDGGHPLYVGRTHLSYHGSVYGARVFEPVVSDILASRSR